MLHEGLPIVQGEHRRYGRARILAQRKWNQRPVRCVVVLGE